MILQTFGFVKSLCTISLRAVSRDPNGADMSAGTNTVHWRQEKQSRIKGKICGECGHRSIDGTTLRIRLEARSWLLRPFQLVVLFLVHRPHWNYTSLILAIIHNAHAQKGNHAQLTMLTRTTLCVRPRGYFRRVVHVSTVVWKFFVEEYFLFKKVRVKNISCLIFNSPLFAYGRHMHDW